MNLTTIPNLAVTILAIIGLAVGIAFYLRGAWVKAKLEQFRSDLADERATAESLRATRDDLEAAHKQCQVILESLKRENDILRSVPQVELAQIDQKLDALGQKIDAMKGAQ